jgi:PII-like signaling protein
MTLPRRAERLSIYLSQTSHHGRSADYVEIVARARQAGMAGAIVLQGTEGFGSSATLHHRHSMAVAEEVPIKVVIVERPERIDAFLEQISDLVVEAMIVRQPVEVLADGRHDAGGDREQI